MGFTSFLPPFPPLTVLSTVQPRMSLLYVVCHRLGLSLYEYSRFYSYCCHLVLKGLEDTAGAKVRKPFTKSVQFLT